MKTYPLERGKERATQPPNPDADPRGCARLLKNQVGNTAIDGWKTHISKFPENGRREMTTQSKTAGWPGCLNRWVSQKGQLIVFVLGLTSLSEVSLGGPEDYLNRKEDWYSSEAASSIAGNIISHQSPLGGWAKNSDTTAITFNGRISDIHPTFDNGATTGELRFLARIFRTTGRESYKTSFIRGLTYILDAQYANGGWPQYSPPGNGYHRHITFNDNSMTRLMWLLRDVARSHEFDFVDRPTRINADAAFDAGIECILKCQIKIDNRLTAWCAQHDKDNFQPATGRAYELPSISGSESVGLVQLLMSMENPSESVILAIESAVSWMHQARISGYRIEKIIDEMTPKGWNVSLIPDPSAQDLWARFYSLDNQTPFFVDRDGIPKESLSDIGYERRNGYAWYGSWPRKLIQLDYPNWKSKVYPTQEK